MNIISWLFLKRLKKTKFLCIINVTVDRAMLLQSIPTLVWLIVIKSRMILALYLTKFKILETASFLP